MQTKESLQKLVDEMSYNDWMFMLRYNGDVPYLQIRFWAPDNMDPNGKMQLQSCRKWMLSYHMCNEEVLSTGLKATLAAVEHETRELFKWKGQPIYRPHYSIDALYELSKSNAVEKRDEPNKIVKAPENVLIADGGA